jgi:MFS family permease
MLIIGRAIQGIGGGGINTMTDIVCDLVPLREWGLFMGVLFAVFAVGTSIGPWVGGSLVTNTTWRWVFYLNIPIGSVGLVLLIAFLQVSYKKEFTLMEKLKRVDFFWKCGSHSVGGIHPVRCDVWRDPILVVISAYYCSLGPWRSRNGCVPSL